MSQRLAIRFVGFVVAYVQRCTSLVAQKRNFRGLSASVRWIATDDLDPVDVLHETRVYN